MAESRGDEEKTMQLTELYRPASAITMILESLGTI